MKRTFRFTHAVLASSVFVTPMLFADTQVTGVNTPGGPPPYLTSVAGNIEITPSGSISGAVDGVGFDSDKAALVVDGNNPIAINVSAAGNAINVTTKGTNATVTINSGSIVQSTGAGDALIIAGTPVTITNSGTLQGGTTGSGVHVTNSGTGASVTNFGGTIKTTGTGPSVLIDAGSSGLVLTNSSSGSTPGTISAIANNSAIRINGDFLSIVNNTTSATPAVPSIISSVTGAAINIGTAAAGDIQNFGTIASANNAGFITGTINIGAVYNGNVTNNSGGLIQATGNDGRAFNISASFNTINNKAGATIQSTGGGAGDAIDIFGASPGTINNAGTIKATNLAYFLNGSSTGIINTGTITSGNNTIFVSPAATLTNGIVNSGNITNTGNGVAIRLIGATAAPLFQNGGVITGNVFLADNGNVSPNFALTMTGGTIIGNVTSSSTTPSTLQLNGGTIAGNTFLGDVAGNTVNLAGTSLQAVVGGTLSDTFNLTGGSFVSINGNGGADVLNVNATYTSIGTITNVPTIKTNNAGTVYTATGTISNISNQLLIAPNTTMIANAGIGGVSGTGAVNIQNGGILQINNGSTVDMGSANNLGNLKIANNADLNLTGAYSQTGAFSPTIQDMTPAGFGVITVGTAATFNPGSNVDPQLGTGSFILNNHAFPIIQTNAAIPTFGNLSVVQPPSAILSFTLDNTIDPTDVNLIAHTKPLALVAEQYIPLSVAASLDNLIPTTPAQVAALAITDPALLGLFGQLQLLPDIQSVSAALMQLAPAYNYALPASSRISMDNAFDSVHARLEGLTRIGPIRTEEGYVNERDYELYNGVNYGDANVIDYTGGKYGVWVKGYATLLDQHKRHQIEGFKAEATGGAFGADWHLTDYALIGVGQSFTKVNTTDYTTLQNKVNVNSAQTTIYGWYAPYQACNEYNTQTLYVEAMMAAASHKYNTIRNIAIGNLQAQATADFYGLQYGTQAEVGYAFVSVDGYLVAPVARARYTYLNIGDYSETGAMGLNLNVANAPLDEMVGGAGLRLAVKRDFIQAVYVAEFDIMFLYDLAGRAQQNESNFIALIGSDPFYTNSIKPAQNIQEYGIGITAYTSDGYTFSLKGNFEHRNQLFAYNGWMMLHYGWD